MQQVYPIFKVHSGSANRNENGGRCCIRKESAVTRKKGCPGVEPDIPNDLIKRQYLNLVCGSGMRHTYCRVGTHSPSEQLPVSLVLVRLVERNQQRPQTHMCLLCLFRYAFIIALWVEFARRIFCPVTIQSSVLKTCPKTNHVGHAADGFTSAACPYLIDVAAGAVPSGTRWGGIAPPNGAGIAAAALSEGSMTQRTEGMPVWGWKWMQRRRFSGETGIIVQTDRYNNGRKGATQ